MQTHTANDKALMIALGGSDPKTIHKYIWPFIDSIFELDGIVVSWLLCLLSSSTAQPLILFFSRQIVFENRKVEDVGNDCLLSVDGTDFWIAKKYKNPLYSYKFKKLGFRYEMGLCIKTGNICWWAGPYLPGILNNEMVFKYGLTKMLEPAERVEADVGCRGSAPELGKCPGVVEVDLDNVDM